MSLFLRKKNMSGLWVECEMHAGMQAYNRNEHKRNRFSSDNWFQPLKIKENKFEDSHWL